MITSFSSAGPTDFGHKLKPDVSAPGREVLSSTPPEDGRRDTFSVFDGTSMATPHVAGAAALLLQQHPGWTPWQVKSALMSTAGPAWGDTARTQEAPVLLEGAGLVNVLTADDPKVFTDPQSLSFQKIDVSTGAQRSSMLADGLRRRATAPALDGVARAAGADERRRDRRAGHGRRSRPAATSRSRSSCAPPPTPATGENYGFVVLTQNGVQRRVPYDFLVERPRAAQA